ncbi:EamA family transporter [Tolypothrix campylonemoides VB511288]|nr:EamA family transporter [Tolypothrix campylonemoides VB511288]
MGYVYIALMLALTLYGQLVLKWQVGRLGPITDGDALATVARLLLSPWVLSGLAAAFAASVCWMLALTRLELSRAYPFTALGLVLIFASSAILFGESLTIGKLLGGALIVAGICVVAYYG